LTWRRRDGTSTKEETGRSLEEFVSLTSNQPKHLFRLICTRSGDTVAKPIRIVVRKGHQEAVRRTLVVMWEAPDRVCGKRRSAVLPVLVESMERQGHLVVDQEVMQQIPQVSAATIDMLLASVRDEGR
jgi:hypothetical protein